MLFNLWHLFQLYGLRVRGVNNRERQTVNDNKYKRIPIFSYSLLLVIFLFTFFGGCGPKLPTQEEMERDLKTVRQNKMVARNCIGVPLINDLKIIETEKKSNRLNGRVWYDISIQAPFMGIKTGEEEWYFSYIRTQKGWEFNDLSDAKQLKRVLLGLQVEKDSENCVKTIQSKISKANCKINNLIIYIRENDLILTFVPQQEKEVDKVLAAIDSKVMPFKVEVITLLSTDEGIDKWWNNQPAYTKVFRQ